MNHPKPSGEIKAVAIATADDLRARIKQKSKLKGRQADDVALAEIQVLIGDGPYRRDLLIENLHLLNDEYRALHDHHLVALAKLMNLPMAEVYEVATFYHHFEMVAAMTLWPILRYAFAMGSRASSQERKIYLSAYQPSWVIRR